MTSCKFSLSSTQDQITNQPTNQGRPLVKLCFCGGYAACLSASARAGVVGYTQINSSQGAGDSIRRFARQRPILRSCQRETQRIQYPPSQFIRFVLNNLEGGVTKP
jgi:hypothetical protein